MDLLGVCCRKDVAVYGLPNEIQKGDSERASVDAQSGTMVTQKRVRVTTRTGSVLANIDRT
jgi:hypothetical protein